LVRAMTKTELATAMTNAVVVAAMAKTELAA
jgi:hypothetical protein